MPVTLPARCGAPTQVRPSCDCKYIIYWYTCNRCPFSETPAEKSTPRSSSLHGNGRQGTEGRGQRAGSAREWIGHWQLEAKLQRAKLDGNITHPLVFLHRIGKHGYEFNVCEQRYSEVDSGPSDVKVALCSRGRSGCAKGILVSCHSHTRPHLAVMSAQEKRR